MGRQSAEGDPLTRGTDEGLKDYLARLRALGAGALAEEQRRSLAALLCAVRLAGEQTEDPAWGHSPPERPR
jgi:hypothetical protein